MIGNVLAVVAAFATIYFLLAFFCLLIEGSWGWGWPLDLLDDLRGREDWQ